VAVALLAIFASIGAGLAVRSASADDSVTATIGLDNSSATCVEDDPTKADEWHFVINKAGSGATTIIFPATIEVVFANAGQVTVPQTNVSANQAGYTVTTAVVPLPDSVVSAEADVTVSPDTVDPNDLNFVISHVPCDGGEPPQDTLTVSKTADTTFTRTHKWSIDKSVDTENHYTHNDLPRSALHRRQWR